MPDASETELKLALRPEDLDALLAHPTVRRLGPPSTLVSTYWDTPDARLAQARLTLRVRKENGRRTQTLKSRGDGLFTRDEWNVNVHSDQPELAAFADTPLAAALGDPSERPALAPVCTIAVERRSHAFVRQGARVDMTLDIGEARAAGRVAPILEIELELAHGPIEAVFALAEPLFEAAPLRLSVRTKAQAGLSLTEAPHSAVRGEDAILDLQMSCAEAFRAIGRVCLTQLLANEALVRENRAAEAVHQTRVAIRRLRAAMSLFSNMLVDPESQRLKAALRRLASALGQARDLDVLIHSVTRLDLPASFDLASLIAALEQRRRDACDEAIAELEQPGSARLLFDTARWLETGAWAGTAAAAGPVRTFAPRVLRKRAGKLRKAARKLAALDAVARHRVRIHAKKLRYGAEFFASLASGRSGRKAVARLTGALEPLQTALGGLNDLANAERQLRDLAGSSTDPNLAFAAGAAADAMNCGSRRLLRRACKAAHRMDKTGLLR